MSSALAADGRGRWCQGRIRRCPEVAGADVVLKCAEIGLRDPVEEILNVHRIDLNVKRVRDRAIVRGPATSPGSVSTVLMVSAAIV